MHIINNSVSIIIDKMFRLGLHAIYKELQVEIGGSERPRGSERPSALKMSGTEATASDLARKTKSGKVIRSWHSES